ncbi:ABC transporter substrate-binding protein [Amycolatopsis sp. A1MSW2902]|uniref:ABC transporter substrate-binding protein n=1 Tax=Amycolatopsis sp. A1MSW2902 TaxID=687413 RepID=UPI00307F0A98
MTTSRPLRRLLLAIAASALMAAPTACGSGDRSAAAAAHDVKHEFGTSALPDDPQVVVALDEYSAMDLLALGIVPKVVFTGYGSAISQKILGTTGSELVKIPVGSTIKSTTVFSYHPDLVVFSSIGDRTMYNQLAPTVPTLPLTSITTKWRDRLTTIGADFRREDKAKHIVDALDRQLAAVKTGHAASTPVSIAVLMSYSGKLASLSGDAQLRSLLTDAAFDTPGAEKRTDSNHQPYLALSPENLVDHEANVTAVLAEGVWNADAVRGQPTFARLRGHPVDVNGDMWSGSFPFAIYWTAADLAAIERGDWAAVAKEKNANERYQQFTEMIK